MDGEEVGINLDAKVWARPIFEVVDDDEDGGRRSAGLTLSANLVRDDRSSSATHWS